MVLVSTTVSFLMHGFTHDTIHASLFRQANDAINDRIETVRAIVAQNRNYLEIIKKDIDWEGEHVALPNYYLRFLDDSMHPLIETPGMSTLIPPQCCPFSPPSRASIDTNNVFKARNGRSYLLKTVSICTSRHSRRPLRVQIALDITSAVAIEKANDDKLLMLGLFRAAIFAAVIVILVRAVLKPLDQMVFVAEIITAKRFSQRANPKGWPKEVRRLADSFNSMLDRLEDAFGRISHSATSMAHEIRTPINNIMGEAEIALCRDRSPEEYRKVLASTVEECQRLSTLISSLLFLAHADNPKDSINCVRFNPMGEIEDIISFYGPQIDSKNAKIACYGTGELMGDPLLFRQAVSNLLRNALNYSPDGVEIAFSLAATADHFDVTVSDTGYGIAEVDLPRISKRFERAVDSMPNRPAGSGLGLSIVKAIMDLHGGSISIKSKPGDGTSVTLTFPTGDSLSA